MAGRLVIIEKSTASKFMGMKIIDLYLHLMTKGIGKVDLLRQLFVYLCTLAVLLDLDAVAPV